MHPHRQPSEHQPDPRCLSHGRAAYLERPRRARWHSAEKDGSLSLSNSLSGSLRPRSVAFDAAVLAQPRVERIAGDPSEGFMTYRQRSLVFGFPDYVSVRTLPAAGGSTLAIWSRSRYGRSDFGVNAERVSTWLGLLQPLEQ